MPSITRNGSRRYAALAFAAALVGAAVSSPAPAAAGTRDRAEFNCIPSSTVTCDIRYHYFDSAAKTNQVGYAEDGCDSSYQLIWGRTTRYVTEASLHCPY